jgi:hypothetical protein
LSPTVEPQENEPLPVLRDSMTEAVDDPGFDAVAECPQRLVEVDDHRPVVPSREIGHVLDEHRGGLKAVDDGDERRPEIGALIVGGSLAQIDEITELGRSRPAEGLAWHTPRHEIHVGETPDVERAEELSGIREVPTPAEARQIRVVRSHSPLVRVGADKDIESRPLKSG